MDTLSWDQTVNPCPVTCMACRLPQRPPPGITSEEASPSGSILAPGDIGSPPAHQAPLRPPTMRVSGLVASMSSMIAVGSTGPLVSPQLDAGAPAAPPPPRPP